MGWRCNTVEKHDQPSEWNASALVQKKQNYYYSLLYTRDKGENFDEELLLLFWKLGIKEKISIW